ncbi:MAG: JAB domain-containing protein [Caldimonas sp.]
MTEPLSLPPTGRDALPACDLAVIDAALAILETLLRKPGEICDSPRLARDYVRLQLAGLDVECFAVMYIDAQSRFIAWDLAARGTLTQTSVYPREIVRGALRYGAAAVLFAHNHPSGFAEPSSADRYLTATLKTALATVDVRVLDHLVVGAQEVVSFAERGLL